MILGDVMVPGKSLKCDVCKWPWVSISQRLPDCCANPECRSREWNGVKLRRKPKRQPVIELPTPKRVRERDDEDF